MIKVDEYTCPMSGNSWHLSESEIEVFNPSTEYCINPMELVDMGIEWLELANKKNWKFFDARGIEILREATLDDFIERLQNVRNETKS